MSIDAVDSRLLGPSLPKNIKNALENEATTANFHDFCMRPEVRHFFIVSSCSTDDLFSTQSKNFSADPTLSTFYRMLTVSSDLEGQKFVSTVESK